MPKGTVKPADFAKAVEDVLQTFAQATADEVAAATKETAERAAQIVRQEAASEYGSDYASEIKARNFRDVYRNGARQISEFITAGRRYRIAHLLEHGHALIRGGRYIRDVEGRAHFAKGQDYIDRNYVNNIKLKIEEARE